MTPNPSRRGLFGLLAGAVAMVTVKRPNATLSPGPFPTAPVFETTTSLVLDDRGYIAGWDFTDLPNCRCVIMADVFVIGDTPQEWVPHNIEALHAQAS